jgi:hypothetical protein
VPPSLQSSLQQHFKAPAGFFNFSILDGLDAEPRLFAFGDGLTGYGRIRAAEYDALPSVEVHDGACLLPFNPDEVLDNLRKERYPIEGNTPSLKQTIVRLSYYTLRPLLPVGVRKYAQRRALRGWDKPGFPGWPVERTVEGFMEKLLMLAMKTSGVDSIPFIWFWPDQKRGCVLMTHDVETDAGLRACDDLMSLNESYGIPASFQVIPGGRYHAQPEHLDAMRRRGFEVNIHDWNHDGHLFSTRQRFVERAAMINARAAEWQTVGFRAAALYRNIDWLRELKFEYDMSIPTTARLDPQHGGCCTLMPWMNGDLLEIPVTTIQDYSLFNILNQYSIDIWRQQTDSILAHHGMASFIVHPDYIQTPLARQSYTNLLAYLAELRDTTGAWAALPGQVNQWWRQRAQMTLEKSGDEWRVSGPGSDHATVAFARLEGSSIVYTFANPAASAPVPTSQLNNSRGNAHA